MLCLLDHRAVLLFVEQGLNLTLQDPRCLLLRGSVAKERFEVLELHLRPLVLGLRIGKVDVDDENDLLSHVVEADDLVKEHQVDVLEVLGVFCVKMEGRLRVL